MFGPSQSSASRFCGDKNYHHHHNHDKLPWHDHHHHNHEKLPWHGQWTCGAGSCSVPPPSLWLPSRLHIVKYSVTFKSSADLLAPTGHCDPAASKPTSLIFPQPNDTTIRHNLTIPTLDWSAPKPTSLSEIIQADISHINGSGVASSRFEEESGAWDAKGWEVSVCILQHLVK